MTKDRNGETYEWTTDPVTVGDTVAVAPSRDAENFGNWFTGVVESVTGWSANVRVNGQLWAVGGFGRRGHWRMQSA